jgi:outer membrane protein TolC
MEKFILQRRIFASPGRIKTSKGRLDIQDDGHGDDRRGILQRQMAGKHSNQMAVLLATAAIALAPTAVLAQNVTFQLQPPPLLQTQDSFKGSITTAPVTADTIPLSMDDAIRRGLMYDLGLVQQEQTERQFKAQVLSTINVLLPNITMQAKTGVDQINLVALGFKPALVNKLAPGLTVQPIEKYDVTNAQAEVKETLFSMQYFDLYRAALNAEKAQALNTLSARGNVIYNVAGAYLQVLADVATAENAKAELDVSQRLLQQSNDRDSAGTATRLDVLRSKVQQQNDEQTLEQAENTLAKDRIALNRNIGLAPEQKVRLTDTAPNAELAARPLDEIRATAYLNRKDYLALLAAVRGYELQSRAIRYERAPVLSFDGNYGVTGITRGLYHGTMLAEGKIEFPLFKEAELRGDRDVANAQLDQARSQLASLRQDVDGQLRSSLLDVEAAEKLVKVAQSNRDLAQEALEQSEERYHAGVDDNLPLVRSEASVAVANSQWVASLYQYNMAKLALARNTGVLETRFKQYLGQ